jgi:AraC-like DNA-binding protein
MAWETQKITREFEIEGFNSIYYFEFGKDFSHPPERHDFWEFAYVDCGEVKTLITDDLSEKLYEGQVMFHRPMSPHAHVSNNLVSHNQLVVSFTCHSEAMEFFDNKVFTLNKTEKTLLSLFIKEAKFALNGIPGNFTDKNALDFSKFPHGHFQLLECYLTEFLILLKRRNSQSDKNTNYEKNERANAQNATIETIIEYLKNNVYENLTVADICAKFFIGKSHLYKLFGEFADTSPMEYFSGMKIKEAKRLLLESDLSVSEIATMLNYSSIHNFSRAFKSAVGDSPYGYKNRVNHVT